MKRNEASVPRPECPVPRKLFGLRGRRSASSSDSVPSGSDGRSTSGIPASYDIPCSSEETRRQTAGTISIDNNQFLGFLLKEYNNRVGELLIRESVEEVINLLLDKLNAYLSSYKFKGILDFRILAGGSGIGKTCTLIQFALRVLEEKLCCTWCFKELFDRRVLLHYTPLVLLEAKLGKVTGLLVCCKHHENQKFIDDMDDGFKTMVRVDNVLQLDGTRLKRHEGTIRVHRWCQDDRFTDPHFSNFFPDLKGANHGSEDQGQVSAETTNQNAAINYIKMPNLRTDYARKRFISSNEPHCSERKATSYDSRIIIANCVSLFDLQSQPFNGDMKFDRFNDYLFVICAASSGQKESAEKYCQAGKRQGVAGSVQIYLPKWTEYEFRALYGTFQTDEEKLDQFNYCETCLFTLAESLGYCPQSLVKPIISVLSCENPCIRLKDDSGNVDPNKKSPFKIEIDSKIRKQILAIFESYKKGTNYRNGFLNYLANGAEAGFEVCGQIVVTRSCDTLQWVFASPTIEELAIKVALSQKMDHSYSQLKFLFKDYALKRTMTGILFEFTTFNLLYSKKQKPILTKFQCSDNQCERHKCQFLYVAGKELPNRDLLSELIKMLHAAKYQCYAVEDFSKPEGWSIKTF